MSVVESAIGLTWLLMRTNSFMHTNSELEITTELQPVADKPCMINIKTRSTCTTRTENADGLQSYEYRNFKPSIIYRYYTEQMRIYTRESWRCKNETEFINKMCSKEYAKNIDTITNVRRADARVFVDSIHEHPTAVLTAVVSLRTGRRGVLVPQVYAFISRTFAAPRLKLFTRSAVDRQWIVLSPLVFWKSVLRQLSTFVNQLLRFACTVNWKIPTPTQRGKVPGRLPRRSGVVCPLVSIPGDSSIHIQVL